MGIRLYRSVRHWKSETLPQPDDSSRPTHVSMQFYLRALASTIVNGLVFSTVHR
jgi:hypothetical protein